MARRPCPGCRQRDQRIAALERRVAELEALVRELQARLGQNASNSSLPPSANPPAAPKPVVKQPSGRPAGGQPGHPPHLRLRLPPERLSHVEVLVPRRCERCQATLAATAHDPPPRWHQVAELPPLLARVTEYQAHGRTCAGCGHVTWAEIPAEVRAHGIGPDLAATHAEVVAAVRQASVKNVDETSWKIRGRLAWLWVAATTKLAAFVIHARRGLAGLQALLGECVLGIVCS